MTNIYVQLALNYYALSRLQCVIDYLAAESRKSVANHYYVPLALVRDIKLHLAIETQQMNRKLRNQPDLEPRVLDWSKNAGIRRRKNAGASQTGHHARKRDS